MHWYNALPLLLGAESSATDAPWYKTTLATLLLLVGVVIAAWAIGKYLGKTLRMTDYSWKIALILGTLGFGIVVVATGWPPKYGVDLQGGVTLIYEVEEPEPVDGETQQINKELLQGLVQALKRRINPAGTREIVVRPYGSKQIEIIVPEVNQSEIEQLKKELVTSGSLRFHIVANEDDHEFVIRLGRDTSNRRVFEDTPDGPVQVGMWAVVAREIDPRKKIRGVFPFKTPIATHTLRDAKTKKPIEPPQQGWNSESAEFERWLADQGIEEVEILMATDDGYNVTGEDIAVARADFDQQANPMISFTVKSSAAKRMRGLTSTNLPEGRIERKLGIVMDDVLISAPTIQGAISTNGQITGSFTQDEVNFIVTILRAGRLPATLKKEPLSENRIDSELGRDLLEQGIFAIGISLMMVLVFMVIYYRFSGVVACWALLTNLVMIVAMVILVKQPFTLTGLAGLVLTVGMSVDANVLIFERIREELNRGSALRLAIRNGFGRATTTIVDANLTTLLTAIVLYTIGTDQIRGFAVTLILGILMSMFTAIFCARAIFEIGERRRWISKLKMMRILGETNIDFIGKRKIAFVLSTIVIAFGLIGVFSRGKGILDIDLGGGSSIEVVLEKPMDPDVVRAKFREVLEEHGVKVAGANVTFTVQEIDRTNDEHPREENTVFKIDASIPGYDPNDKRLDSKSGEYDPKLDVNSPATYDEKHAEEVFGYLPLAVYVKKAFPENLEMHTLDFTPLQIPGSASLRQAPRIGPRDNTASAVAGNEVRRDLPDDSVLALADDAAPAPPAASDAAEPPSPGSDAKAADDTVDSPETQSGFEETSPVPDSGDATTPQPDDPPAGGESNSAAPKQTTLTFAFPQKGATIHDKILGIATRKKLGLDDVEEPTEEPGKIKSERITLTADMTSGDTTKGYTKWDLEMRGIPIADAQTVLDELKSEFDNEPYYPTKSVIGSQIAGDMMTRAVAALMFSLIGIVIYIWIRFQRVVFGLAAVVALVHDVLVVLGAFAVSTWLAGVFGFLGVVEFKISLPVVAAFLTIIGYSLNDTIVVFDRIREVRGKSPELTGEMINRSIGQTLSRTILTSFTTFLVVAILYAGGGNAIHAFAFALVVGVIVGTYSSIFVASPVLLWLVGNRGKAASQKAA